MEDFAGFLQGIGEEMSHNALGVVFFGLWHHPC
jgi:hypothetical protein